jgi:hypothetical protein
MEYAKPFLIGGSVIAGSKYVSTLVNPALAPLVGGMPTGIIASFFLSSNKEKKKFYTGYAYSSLVLFFSVLFIHKVSDVTSYSIDMISIAALFLWAAISYVVINNFAIKK